MDIIRITGTHLFQFLIKTLGYTTILQSEVGMIQVIYLFLYKTKTHPHTHFFLSINI